MILPIRERRDFQRLAADGTRIRSSALWCTCCPTPELDPTSSATRVAFALPRHLGTAVQRNRLRRRLRQLLREADQTQNVPTGLLMIGARPRAIELTFDQLRTEVRQLMDRARLVCSA